MFKNGTIKRNAFLFFLFYFDHHVSSVFYRLGSTWMHGVYSFGLQHHHSFLFAHLDSLLWWDINLMLQRYFKLVIPSLTDKFFFLFIFHLIIFSVSCLEISCGQANLNCRFSLVLLCLTHWFRHLIHSLGWLMDWLMWVSYIPYEFYQQK